MSPIAIETSPTFLGLQIEIWAILISAFAIPFVLSLALPRSRRLLLLAAAALAAVALVWQVAAGAGSNESEALHPVAIAALVVFLFAVWCAGVGSGALLRRPR